MNSVKLFLGTILLVIVFVTPVSAYWQAGVAKVKITPEFPMWMSGYASRNQPAQGTLHDLWAKSLVFEDSQGAIGVLITLDLVGIDRETSQAICKQIQKKHKLPRSAIAICTSHTHTGPVVGLNLRSMYRDRLQTEQIKEIEKYTQRLIEKVVKVVGSAMANRGSATLSYGTGEATFAVNRRNNREPDVPKLRKEGDLRGPVDHDVPVLAVRNEQGKLIAITTAYACHATVLSFYQWSGDWPGFAQIQIEKDFPGAIALFWAGCGGDQNPLPRRKVELAQKYGRQLADAVKRVMQTRMKPVKGEFKTHFKEVKLPLAELPSVDELKKDMQSQNQYIVSRARMLLEKIENDSQLDKV